MEILNVSLLLLLPCCISTVLGGLGTVTLKADLGIGLRPKVKGQPLIGHHYGHAQLSHPQTEGVFGSCCKGKLKLFGQNVYGFGAFKLTREKTGSGWKSSGVKKPSLGSGSGPIVIGGQSYNQNQGDFQFKPESYESYAPKYPKQSYKLKSNYPSQGSGGGPLVIDGGRGHNSYNDHSQGYYGFHEQHEHHDDRAPIQNNNIIDVDYNHEGYHPDSPYSKTPKYPLSYLDHAHQHQQEHEDHEEKYESKKRYPSYEQESYSPKFKNEIPPFFSPNKRENKRNPYPSSYDVDHHDDERHPHPQDDEEDYHHNELGGSSTGNIQIVEHHYVPRSPEPVPPPTPEVGANDRKYSPRSIKPHPLAAPPPPPAPTPSSPLQLTKFKPIPPETPLLASSSSYQSQSQGWMPVKGPGPLEILDSVPANVASINPKLKYRVYEYGENEVIVIDGGLNSHDHGFGFHRHPNEDKDIVRAHVYSKDGGKLLRTIEIKNDQNHSQNMVASSRSDTIETTQTTPTSTTNPTSATSLEASTTTSVPQMLS